MWEVENTKICVVGLGYVGLPLAVAFGSRFPTVGYDTNTERVKQLVNGVDSTLEVNVEEFAFATSLSYTSSVDDIRDCNVYIISVPTPIDEFKKPDLKPLFSASADVGSLLKSGDIVIYESTVYPGATEEDCVPILEQASKLVFNRDFYVGYSPERINPGDKKHRLRDILKVTSGSTARVADFIDELYGSIIYAGTYKASSIRVAEAAKVIENTQRDLNIALVNELAIIFDRLGIDTADVLEAAGTKWNFLPFRPGLVGGHCIGVDPYYLTHKAESIGCYPEIILAGRRINDSMGDFVAWRIVREMIKRELNVSSARVLVLGLSFKENCPDVRNTRVTDVITELKNLGMDVDVHDPWVSPAIAEEQFGIKLINALQPATYDGVVVAVAHQEFLDLQRGFIRTLCKEKSVIYDLKGVLSRDESDIRL